jgi:hypothetical protein
LLEDELDAGKAGAAHEVALRGEEPTGVCRSLDYELLDLAIGRLNAKELENARYGGVVEELVTNRPVTLHALSTASEAHQRLEGVSGAHAAIMRAFRRRGNQRSSRRGDAL